MKLRNKKVIISVEDKLQLATEETDKEAMLHKNTTLNLMEASIAELNDTQRDCITKFYLEKKSYNEIVDATGYSLLQVKSYIQNGKRNLKILIENKMKGHAGK